MDEMQIQAILQTFPVGNGYKREGIVDFIIFSETQKQSLLTENDLMKQKLADCVIAIKRLSAEKGELQQEIENTQSTNISQSEIDADIQNIKDECQLEIASLKSEYEKQNAELKAQSDISAQTINDNQVKLNELQSQVTALLQEKQQNLETINQQQQTIVQQQQAQAAYANSVPKNDDVSVIAEIIVDARKMANSIVASAGAQAIEAKQNAMEDLKEIYDIARQMHFMVAMSKQQSESTFNKIEKQFRQLGASIKKEDENISFLTDGN